jgi:hypothetical protein
MQMKLIVIYLAVSLVFSTVQYFLAVHRVNNLWLLRISAPIEYAFLAIFFAMSCENARVKIAMEISALVFALICLAAIYSFEDIRAFNNVTKNVECLLLVSISAYSLYKLSLQPVYPIYGRPTFWISSATLVRFSGSAVLYSLSNYFLRVSPGTLGLAWSANSFFNVVFAVLISIAFLCKQSQ